MDEIRTGVEAEALKDSRVKDARCTVSWEPVEKRFVVKVQCTTALGPFRLVMAIDALTAQLLRIDA
jgi:hypothetical protein